MLYFVLLPENELQGGDEAGNLYLVSRCKYKKTLHKPFTVMRSILPADALSDI
jgi:hypothetical protein